jgi:hypothetical protein
MEAGSVVSGWNIGYLATPMDPTERKLRGFDIPFLATRARKYGLQQRLVEAIGRHQVRDIGAEYAIIAARVALQNQALVDKEIHEQAVGLSKALWSEGIDISDPAQISEAARKASIRGIKFAGWKQELMYGVMFGKQYEAHQAAKDVRAGMELATLSHADIERKLSQKSRLARWNREVGYNKLVSSLRAGVGEEKAFQSFAEMEARAASLGYTTRFEEDIAKTAKEYGVGQARLRAGRGIGIERYKTFLGKRLAIEADESLFRVAAKRGVNFLAQHKLGIGIAAGIGALAIIEPGSWFSGKDDAYNVIEGLPERGLAGVSRKYNTDFGSGAVGSKTVSRAENLLRLYRGTGKEILAHEAIKARGSFRAGSLAAEIFEKIRATEFPHRPSRLTSTFWSPDIYAAEAYAGSTGFVSVVDVEQSKAFMTSGSFWRKAYNELNEEKLKELARQYWTGIKTVQDPTRYETSAEVLLPGRVTEHITLRAAGSDKFFLPGSSTTISLEEIIAKETGYTQLAANVPIGKFAIPGFDDAYNTIEGLSERGISGASRKKNTDFGSGSIGAKILARGMSLFRGTAKKITYHVPQGSKNLPIFARQAEDIFENVRLAHYSNLPSRMESTFWTPTRRHAKVYAKGLRGHVSQITVNPEQVFFGNTTLSNEMMVGVITKQESGFLEEIAHRYWQGIPREKFAELAKHSQIEALIPNAVKSEKTTHKFLFSGKDDAYNTVEGLQERGLAGQLRKTNTDFGSGWDALRGLVRAGETFASMTKSKAFRQALNEATQEKLLGEGMFGTAYLMKGKFRGQEFQFVRKTGEIGPKELAAMKAMEESVGPSLYGASLRRSRGITGEMGMSGTVDMELFSGRTLSAMSPEALAKIQGDIPSVFQQLHSKGFVHKDPHLGNIMAVETSKGTQLGLIDYGNAARITKGYDPFEDITSAQKLAKAKIEGRSQLGAIDPFAQPQAGIDPFAQQQVSLGEVMKSLPAESTSSSHIKRKQAQLHREAVARATGNMNNPVRHTRQAGNVVR